MNASPAMDAARLTAVEPLPRRLRRALWRGWDRLSLYLPVLLMGLLALLTFWLVRNTPILTAPASAPLPAREPDYTMQGFSVQHFDVAGRLKGEVSGAEARHFPATDTLEVAEARLRLFDASGRLTRASSSRAITNGDGSEVQLLGNARVQRDGVGAEPPLQFSGEFLHVFSRSERLRSHKPVQVVRGADRFSADALDYDHAAGVLELRGNVRVTLAPPAR